MYLFFRIEVAWEPAPPAAPAMATIGPLLQQRRFAEARPLLETLLQLQPEHPEALDNLGVLASEEGRLEEARLLERPGPGLPDPRGHGAAGPRSGSGCWRMRTQGWGSGRRTRRPCGCTAGSEAVAAHQDGRPISGC
jgi:hypothetical protein